MKKIALISIMMLVFLSLVVGCSGSNGLSDKPASSSENDESASSDKNGSDSAEGKTKIEFWSWVPKEPIWPDIEKEFESKYPNIDVEYVLTTSKPDYENKLKVAMASRQGPDVIGTQYGALMNSFLDQLEPLEPYARKEWGDQWIEQFKPGAVSRIQQYPGVPALPAGLVAVPLIEYDAELFEQAGASIPKTYEELKQVLKTFKEANLPGVLPHVGFGGGEWGPQVRALFYNLANQVAPYKIYEADAGKIPFTDPDLVQAATLMKQYADDNIFQPGYLGNKLNPDVQNELFENQQAVPMIIIGSWGAFDWTERETFHIEDRKFGYFPLPPSVGDKPHVQVDVDLALAMTTYSKNKEAAWQFIKFMVSEGYQKVLSKALQNIPAAAAVGLDKSVLTVPSEQEALDVILELAENPIGVRALEHGEIETALFQNLQAMMAGELTPQEAMEKVQEVSAKIKR